MKLKKMLKNIPVEMIRGSKDIEITGLSANSKDVAPGTIFIAKKGSRYDGNAYVLEAISNGATAVLTDIYNPFLKDIVQIIHSDVTSIEAALAEQYYDKPGSKLFVVGVTGTNGKTTTATLIKHIMDSIGKRCGLIGTNEYIIGDHHYHASHTTPDVITNHRLLHDMTTKDCSAAVIEVSSHALSQGRTKNIPFDTAIFTNLSQEHLDYHKTMKNYAASKAILFETLGKQHNDKTTTAIVNKDDRWHKTIIKNCHSNLITYGMKCEADLRIGNISHSEEGTSFDIIHCGEVVRFSWGLLGVHNIYNCLSAVALGTTLGIPLKNLSKIIASFPGVAGRLERVENPLNLKIYVDYAVTPDAIQNALSTLQALKPRRIIVVFGCGGDRDKSKRSKMAKICEKNADFSVITSDNPRSEDPTTICKEIAKGFRSSSNFTINIDRKDAIAYAIEYASAEDIILIAGKGHEKYQIFSHNTIEFNDKDVVNTICEEKTTLAV